MFSLLNFRPFFKFTGTDVLKRDSCLFLVYWFTDTQLNRSVNCTPRHFWSSPLNGPIWRPGVTVREKWVEDPTEGVYCVINIECEVLGEVNENGMCMVDEDWDYLISGSEQLKQRFPGGIKKEATMVRSTSEYKTNLETSLECRPGVEVSEWTMSHKKWGHVLENKTWLLSTVTKIIIKML